MNAASKIIAALGGDQSSKKCRCPAHADKKPSLHVTEKNGKVLVKCFAGCSQEAVIEALRQRGLWQTHTDKKRVRLVESAETTGTEDIARELLDAARETDELPKAYLRQRGIKRSPPTLKMLGRETMRLITGIMLPAMIAPVATKDGEIIGVHVTYLTADAKENAVGKNGKARRMYGKIGGGRDVLKVADPKMPFIVGEGIETVLSAMQITGLPGAAALSASNLSKFDPPECSEIIIAADADEPGMDAAKQLADRLVAAGHKVRIAVPQTPDHDWNDELIASGDTK